MNIKCTASNVVRSARELALTAQPFEKYLRVDDILMVWSQLPSRIEWMILYDGCIDSFNLEHRTSNHFASPYFEPCDLKMCVYDPRQSAVEMRQFPDSGPDVRDIHVVQGPPG